MRNIGRAIILPLSVLLGMTVIITCIKVEKVVMVSTGSVRNVQTNTATAEGTIVDIGEGVADHGHVYSTTRDVTMSGTKVALGSKGTTGTFTSELTNLTSGTTYYIKAYVMGNGGTQLGKEMTFRTADPVVPTVTTTAVTAITATTASSGGDISSDGGSPVTTRGVCWSTSAGPTIADSKNTDGGVSGTFSCDLAGLTEGTVYFVRAYATNAAGTGYGNEISFSTLAVVLPTVTTAAATNISSNSAQGGGTVTSDGGAPVEYKGICWSKNSNPTINDPKTNDGTGTGSFGNSMFPLEPGTLYHVRAYATNSKGTAYGEDLTFTTLANTPTVTTTAISNITSNTASSGGNVTSEGGSAVTERGICWSTSPFPTTSDPKCVSGTGSGTYTCTLTGLSPSTIYYVRAYAINSVGTAYGDEIVFTSGVPVVAPTVYTSAITAITTTEISTGGDVTNNGGALVESRGVCWSTTLNPTIADQKTVDGSGNGTYTSTITGLTPGTTYHIRAYATNAGGLTGYGSDFTAVTNAITVPTVTTTTITGITSNSATSGGNVTADGGDPVTSKGVCWSTAIDPTTADLKTIDGTGLGTFSSALAGLSPGTIYYVRAYATNTVGTGYGASLQLTTSVAAANISTLDLTSLASSTVITGGDITSDGGSAITVRGVCWGLATNPTIVLTSKTNEGSGSGRYLSRVPGLSPNTTYYLRAYATNSKGDTYYGNEISFTTTIQVNDFDGYTYNTVLIGTQLWMQENLKTTRYRDGTSLVYETNNANWAAEIRGAYSWYGNSTTIGDTYGAIYNYYATIDNHNLCPAGWHVPTDAEWTTMENYLITNRYNYDDATSGNKLAKSLGSLFSWTNSTNIGAIGNTDYPLKRDVSGFSALAGGLRNGSGLFTLQGLDGNWWSTTSFSATDAYNRNMSYNSSAENRITSGKNNGMSVRCMQGEGQVLPAVTTTAISGITASGAISGGNVTSTGNDAVTVRGVCIDITPNPILGAGNYTTNGNGIGTFTSSIGGLSPNTIYYVRAYATNSVGTAYGNEVSFTTLP